jgi:hypothetical protein
MSEAEDFLKIGTQEWPSSATDEIRLSKRALLITASWIVGGLIACPDPRAIIMMHLFPLGLTYAVCKLLGNDNPHGDMLVYGGWLIYVVLIIAALMVARKKWFYYVWIFMTLLLLFNGVSCHSMIKS